MSRYKSNNASDNSLFKDSGDEEEGKSGTSKQGVWNHINELRDMCREKDCEIKKLKVELKLSKLQGRYTKQKMRSDLKWNKDDAKLAN